MNQLQIFNNPNFGEIRTINENGKVLFCGSDSARMLGYASPKDAVSAHCKGAVKRRTPTNGGMQEMSFITEGDLYRLITNSKLPAAEKFESWVFDEVLPQIRQTGGYIKVDDGESDEAIMAKAFLIAQKTIASKDRQIEQMKPKVIFAEAMETSEDSILVGELARLLKQNGIDIGQNRLFEKLRADGYLCKKRGEMWNLPTQKAMDMQLFEIKRGIVENNSGTRSTTTTMVTGKGQSYFVNKFKS